MKKIFLICLVALAVGLFVSKDVVAEMVLISTVTKSFNISTSTTSTTGLLVANSLTKARIKNITVSWKVDSSTGTLALYDNLKGANATKIYEVQIPSTTAAENYIQESYEIAAPKLADYGLLAILDNPAKEVIVVVEYW